MYALILSRKHLDLEFHMETAIDTDLQEYCIYEELRFETEKRRYRNYSHFVVSLPESVKEGSQSNM